MKKILTLLFCSMILTSAFAQRNDHDRKDNRNYSVYQNNNYRIDQRNRMIQKINHEYDFKIQQIRNDRRMNHHQKKYNVRRLEAEKAQRINRIYAEFNNNTVYSRSGNGSRDYKTDNGHHDRDWDDR
ncbi:MAG: hypothetical protein ABI594_05295 [Ginsengibacter sp.]